MDVVFMGTPDFAVPSLERLAETHRVIGVYTRPDAASKRGRSLVAPPVKVAAQRLHVPVFQPLTLRDPAEIDRLRTLSPDVICVAAYGMILPSQVLEIPQHGCINVHASLLPRYRGAAPIHRAVLDGATTVGVSIMRMEEGLDTGPYALQRAIDVDDLDVPELTSRLGSIGAEALVETLADMESGSVEWTVQNDAEATYANKVTREDVELDPALTVSEAVRRVRASTRQAPAALEIDGTSITVLKAATDAHVVEPGGVLAQRSGLLIGMSDGTLRLDRIKPAGKGEMDGSAWVCGARLPSVCGWKART